jgi:hypothetical protein
MWVGVVQSAMLVPKSAYHSHLDIDGVAQAPLVLLASRVWVLGATGFRVVVEFVLEAMDVTGKVTAL